MRAANAILELHWATTEPALRRMYEIASKPRHVRVRDLQALEKQLGRPLENTYEVTVRDGIAVIPVRGDLFRYANWMTRMSGGTAYSTLARDFNAALKDPSIKGILFHVDSPGGEVNGCHELAEMIYAARGIKPIKSYVGFQGCSGGYWLPSATDEVICDPTAMLGSIGVIWAHYDYSKAEKEAGIREIVIVSDQSPHKHTDPATKDGYERMSALATQLAGVFINRVARNRGVSEDDVINKFGRGWVLVGQEAVDAGLANRLGSFESVLEEMGRNKPARTGIFSTSAKGKPMDVKEKPAEEQRPADQEPGASAQQPAITKEFLIANHAELVAAFRAEGRAEGVAAENARIKAIEEAALPGHADLLAKAKGDTSMTAEAFALAQIKAENKAGELALQALEKDENENKPPAAAATGDDTSQPSGNGIGAANPAKVQRILNAGKRQKS